MNNKIYFKIADLLFVANSEERVCVDEAFLPFYYSSQKNNNILPDIHLQINYNNISKDLDIKKKLFTVVYPNESILKNYYWNIFLTTNDLLYFKSSDSLLNKDIYFEALFNGFDRWTIFIKNNKIFFYPLSHIILYYSLIQKDSIILHSAQVVVNNKIWLFVGKSGSGKSTISQLFNKYGYRVINDDKSILRIINNQVFCFNIPLYKNAENTKYLLDKIFFINHGKNNFIKQINKIQSIAKMFSNIIQHNFSEFFINKTFDTVEQINNKISNMYELYFVPEISLIDFLRNEFPH